MGTTGITVAGGNTSLPYVSQSGTNPIQGMIRIWGSDMQVFDGNSWMNLSSSYATVSLDPETQDLLQWARTQRTLQLNRQTLLKNNPALAKAYEAVLRAEENFDLLATIAGEYEHVER